MPRRYMIVVLLAVFPIGTSAAAAAQARRAPVSHLASPDPIARAVAVAERYWGAVPCGGAFVVKANQPPAGGLDANTDAWVTFHSSLRADDLEAPASTYSDCAISIAKWQWPTKTLMREDWDMFCLTVTHEVGHLLGHPHSSVPGSVMAPVFINESNVPAICRTTGSPTAHHSQR